MYSGLSPHFDAILGPVEMLPKHALDIARDAGASQTDPADNENPAFECRRGSRRYFSWVECKSFRFRSASFRLEALLFGVEDSYCSQAEMVPRMCTRCGLKGRRIIAQGNVLGQAAKQKFPHPPQTYPPCSQQVGMFGEGAGGSGAIVSPGCRSAREASLYPGLLSGDPSGRI